MTPDEIKAKIESLDMGLRFQQQRKQEVINELHLINGAISLLLNNINEVRRKCEHTYLDKPNTSVGRGVCEICGDNDY